MKRDFIILGAEGQLGRAFARALGDRAQGWAREAADLGDAVGLDNRLRGARPQVVVNAAAFNQVDAAESRRQAALAANFDGPATLARLSRRQGWKLVHFSTDYVFGGDFAGGATPRLRDETDPPAPVNFYGYSKLMGEEAVLRLAPNALVLRVAHLFGGEAGRPERLSLPLRWLASAAAGESIRVSDGQTLNPTGVADIVRATLQLVASDAKGLFHLTGEGTCSAGEYAESVLELGGFGLQSPRPAQITVVAHDERPARRAPHTALQNRRLAEVAAAPMPHWRASLESYLQDRRTKQS